ncbi:MAG: hypothetical protein GEU79_08130 [Acidimicrobiia bacterium]|nr:hypothetical protein [Acidimicrobiia bacterium]
MGRAGRIPRRGRPAGGTEGLMGTLKVSIENMKGGVALGRQENDHTLLLDRPVATGGTGLGFNGGHLLLLGWGGCFKSNLVAAADARQIEITRLELEIGGETADSPARFVRFSMKVRMDGPEESMKAKLLTIAKNSCIVSNTLASAALMDVELQDD